MSARNNRGLLRSLIVVAGVAGSLGAAGCSSAASGGSGDEGALVTHPAATPAASAATVLETEGAGSRMELRFGIAPDKSPIVEVERDGQKRTLHCSSFINVTSAHPERDQIEVSCTEDLVPGTDWCEIDFERTSADHFKADVTCEYTSAPDTHLPDSLAKTYAVLSGDPAPNDVRADKHGISLKETRKAGGALADDIAFTEALVTPLRELLTKKQTVSEFRTHAVTELAIDRVAAHPRFAEHGTQLVAFASAYSAHVDQVSVEGSPGTLASTSDIVSRIVATATCTEQPPNMPHCVH